MLLNSFAVADLRPEVKINALTAHAQTLLGRVALAAQRPIVIKLSRVRFVGRSVCRSVGLSVCPVHCRKTADRIRQPFGTIGRTGPRMRQVLGFANRSTERGTFGGEFGPHHSNQWGLLRRTCETMP